MRSPGQLAAGSSPGCGELELRSPSCRSDLFDPLFCMCMCASGPEAALRRVRFDPNAEDIIPVGHPVITWVVRRAAMVTTMRVVGADGKTGWQLARGATCRLKLVKFGEVTRYKCRSQDNGIFNPSSIGVSVYGSELILVQANTYLVTRLRTAHDMPGHYCECPM